VRERSKGGTDRREDDRDVGPAGCKAGRDRARGAADHGTNDEDEQRSHGSIAVR
jgi:hypothetical protein